MDRRQKQNTIDHPDQRQTEVRLETESSLTIKWWGILLVFFAVISWLTITATGTADRVTKLEATSTYVAASISEIKDMVKEIKNDLKERR